MIRENVQIYIVSSKNHKVLMLKRTEEKSGYWQPVCGGIENHELAYDAALREVYEETGLNDYISIEKLPFEYDYIEPKNGVVMKMHDQCYLMIIDDQCDIKISHEHDQYKWIEFDEASSLTNWNPIISVCEYLNSTLKMEQQ